MENDRLLEIKCGCDPQFALAMHQNRIPLIRSLHLTNHGSEELRDLRIEISFSPAFASPYVTTAALVGAGETVEIAPVKITVLPEFLSAQTETVSGTITVSVYSGEELISSAVFETSVLAVDQWTGTGIMPELTAAYITPNHPAVMQTVNKAAHYLMKWSGDPSFTGYQTQDPNKARLQMAALYAALQEENIAYTMPPASFETMGQRVRLPHTVLEQRCGTCLDLSLLFCACAEAVGLSPILVFLKGHAFAACWLGEETFANCAVDDPSALTKRTADGINLICPVECTLFAAGKTSDFDSAVKYANEELAESDRFELAVDIKRCRGNGIRPLPLTADGKYDFEGFGERQSSEITDTPAMIDPSALRVADGTSRTATKQEMWERKLLDLSLRNSLVNFVPGSSNVQLVTADLGRLEDELARGESFKIMPAPSELSLALTDQKIYRAENDRELIASIAESEFASKRLRTFLKESELEAALKKLHRKAKLSMEENGANTLYLALGFLCWYETEKSTKRRYAPLVLVPVDIIRKISEKVYTLRIRSEDTQMNITLLEMLRQDFGIRIDGLDPLPVDESGADLQMVFNTMRRAVMQKQRWDIEELAFLGQFSFGRFIMWNDIRNRCEELKNNKVVASLISGKMEWQPKDIELSPAQIDAELDPLDIAVPTSADSSQLAAVCAASEGESFVLHGPPGTGKSQTITNMIANALYHGKSVLFVAEKMAALSVVQERLKKLGLDPFCLELHSNKAQKRSVLNQLESALEVGRLSSPEGFEAEAQKLKAERQRLSSVMNALHKKRSVGMSLYEAVTVYDKYKQYDGCITLEKGLEERITPEGYSKALELIKRISVAGEELGGLAFSPLRSYRRTDHSFDLKEGFIESSKRYGESVRRAAESYDLLCEALEPGDSRKYDRYIGITELLELASAGEFLSPAVYGGTPVTDSTEALDGFVSKVQAESGIASELMQSFDAGILSADAEGLRDAWSKNQQKWFIGRALGKRKLLKKLRAYAKSPDSVTEDSFESICGRVTEYQRLKAETDSVQGSYAPSLGELWQGEATDFGRLAAYRSNTVRMHSIISRLGDSAVSAAVGKAASCKDRIGESSAAYRTVMSCQKELASEYRVDLGDVFAAEDWFAAAEKLSEGFVSGSDRLRERSVLEGLLEELDGLGYGDLTTPYRKGFVTEEDYYDAFVCAAARMTVVSAISSDSQLSSFQGAQFEVSLAQYRQTVADYRSLTVKELIARLSAKIPASADGMRQGSSETAILQKAIKSGGRSLSIRSLFESIPTLLRRICPCMLMSPISVAQYIDPKYPKFDIVIFDEASQMPTSEAVGAMARGDNVVIVGDPRQLPPTSFFSVQHTDEENIDKEDLESVLDDCLALTMPQKHLLWHYRSRHESLIAFSNARFYENKLRTFPSPDDRQRKVTRVQVEGVYDKSGTRQNRAEAEAVVAEIVRRLSDEKLRKYSIGVVTFSSIQQNLIDDLLSDAFVKQPELEELADKMYEPIFIKNLENVQGDERDVILFSVGYGPDKNGKVSMNFGPLNQDGGWRRLNVAVSRARREMTVYSVLRPDQIDLTRTQAAGVAELKYFLEFAERGTQTLARNAGEEAYEADGFAQLIAEELTKRGYEVRCGIGCSGFRVDVGVLDPNNDGEFILGIMLGSGRNYRNASTDDIRITQPSVLTGLGWNICNVHILDWLDDREGVIRKLAERIEHIRQGGVPETETVVNTSAGITGQADSPKKSSDGVKRFVPCVLPIMGDAESFVLPKSQRKIVVAIGKVIAAEAPLSLNSLTKNVLSAWGIARKSKAVTAAFESALRAVEHKETEGGSFIWRCNQSPEDYREFRTGSGTGKRKLEDICIEEVCAAVMYVLDAQISMPENDLVLAAANLFGYTRASAVEERVMQAADLAVRRGLAVRSDGKILLNS